MKDLLAAPQWIQDAFAEAKKLANDANDFWREHLGETGDFGGFQVRPVGLRDAIEFELMLWGGDHWVASAAVIARFARQYVLERRDRRKKVRP